MEKISTDAADYLFFVRDKRLRYIVSAVPNANNSRHWNIKRDVVPETYGYDAAYGESLSNKELLAEFALICSGKQPQPQLPKTVCIAEKYLIIPPIKWEGDVTPAFIGAGLALCALSADALHNMLKSNITRREFIKLGFSVIAGATLLKKYDAIDGLVKEISKQRKERRTVPYGEASAAITAVLLEAHVAPRIKDQTNKKPAICIVLEEAITDIDQRVLAGYLQDIRTAKKMLIEYQAMLAKEYGMPKLTDYLIKLHFFSGEKEHTEVTANIGAQYL